MSKDPIAIILNRMNEVGMKRADLVQSSGISRQNVDRYLGRKVMPSTSAWLAMLGAVGLDFDTRVSSQWSVAERAEKISRRAQVLEMQSADRPASAATLDLFLAHRSAS